MAQVQSSPLTKGERIRQKMFTLVDCYNGTVVKHSAHHLKVNGSSPVITLGKRRYKMAIKRGEKNGKKKFATVVRGMTVSSKRRENG